MRAWLHRRSPAGGFTFNELLVAMSIAAIAVLGLSLTIVAVIRGNKGNDNFAAAVNLAHDKMEELKAATDLVVEDRCPGGGDVGIGHSAAPGGIFDRCWSIAPSPLGTRLKQIDVTVSWREAEARQVTLSSLKFVQEER
jgi:prepilin-type N-terminal cleavage/methylation domain-containing protein